MVYDVRLFLFVVCGAGLLAVLYIVLRKTDPLPKREPGCIWHTTVSRLDRVYDGDTFYATIRGHSPIDGKPAGIRIRGVDTPERRDERPPAREKAEKAREFVEAKLKSARRIHLYNVNTRDKYGRILATVFCDRRDLARMLIEQKLAKPYDGGKKAKWR